MSASEASNRQGGGDKRKHSTPPPGRVPLQKEPYEEPSMTTALFVYWIIPVLIFAFISRYTVDTTVPTIPLDESTPSRHRKPRRPPTPTTSKQSPVPPSPEPSAAPSWPTSYRHVVDNINKRRRRIQVDPGAETNNTPTAKPTSQQQHRRSSDDPTRQKVHDKIDGLRKQHEQDPDDLIIALTYADAMRYYDVNYHDGGSYEQESIAMYDKVVSMAEAERQKLISEGKSTSRMADGRENNVAAEVVLEYSVRSIDGKLCGIYTSQGKTYFMANWFEKAVESYTKCLKIEPEYLDAVNSRGSANIILGRYEEAGADLLKVIQKDTNLMFSDAFQGLARVLQTKEDAVPGGWEDLTVVAEPVVPHFEARLQSSPSNRKFLENALTKVHHALFLYHDSKTKNYTKAFDHLSKSYKHKMSSIPRWQAGSEMAKVAQSKSIFRAGFWPSHVGSRTKVPIFIVGFVRSGSTLLERVLDAHPMIVGTGENSVFNGRLPIIRNEIVKTSVESPDAIGDVTRKLADDVVEEMKSRWQLLSSQSPETTEDAKPERFVDKMLTNYYNIGFIQMLYPNALILHVIREPMDTVFSAYKHEFPPGTLDYTSDFGSLAELYRSYRDIMKHWDEVLPGRVTHVRYEDMVHDMPGMARAIVAATGLPWDESVLDFHRKKHAVNTLSTTQVRKGIYKDSLKSWMRYEEHLLPLVEKLGDLVDYDLSTSLPGYTKPEQA